MMDGGEGWAMMGWLGHGLDVRLDRACLVYYDRMICERISVCGGW